MDINSKSDRDEELIRKKIRQNLIEKHKLKKEKEKKEEKTFSDVDNSISKTTLKKYIQRIIEEKLYSQHPKFIKCSNHLGEIRWLTIEELTDQYEFYQVEETTWERLVKKIFSERLKKLPNYDWIEDYKKQLEKEIASDIKKRLQKIEELKKQREDELQTSRVQEIIAQEEQAFYRSHPDYKLYRNYVGQESWLTKEEFEKQDEFIEEVKTTREKIITYTGWSLIIGIVAAIIIYLTFFINGSVQKGYLVINTNKEHGQLYINERLILGFTPNKPLYLSEGEYQIYFQKAGFKSTPSLHTVNIKKNDTTKIEFNLEPIDIASQATVFIQSNLNDVKIFVNNYFYGTTKNNPHILLNPGNYEITLKKTNYDAIPAVEKINIIKGDTVNVSFKFVPRGSINNQVTSVHYGLLEISSNIRGAKIIFDNKESHFTTNYIMDRVPFGKHIISLAKEGYRVKPVKREIILNHKNPHIKVNFELARNSIPITIKTQPVEGEIYIDKKDMGRGKWQGELPLGEYNIHFGKIEYYKEPEPRKILVTEEGQTNFVFLYTFNFYIIFTPNKILPNNDIGSIQLGYLSDERYFTSDPKNGPEISSLDQAGKIYWKLGYAFKYRNPPESDAILFRFQIPKKINLKNNIYLRIWGYNTETKYPLQISGKSKIQIAINDNIIQNKYTPKYTLDQANDSTFEQFLINNLLRYGKNTVRIATNASNTIYYAIQKVSIE